MLQAIGKPFGWLLLKLYELTGNYGIALILFAVVIRLILMPFTVKSRLGVMKTQLIAPQMKELEKRHGTNSPKYAEEVRKLYKEEGIKPLSSCLWAFIQFPILLALYQAIRYPLTVMMGVPAALLQSGGAIAEKLTELGFSTTMSSTYVQIAQTEFISKNFEAFRGLSDKLVQIDFSFLGLNLGDEPSYKFWTFFETSDFWPMLGLFLIPLLTALATYLQSYITMKKSGTAGENDMLKSTMAAMPIIMLLFCFSMPAAIGVYWIAGSVFTIIQELILSKVFAKKYMQETLAAEERARQREMEWENRKADTEIKRKLGTTEKNPNTSKKKIQQQERLEREAKQADWEKEHGIRKEKQGGIDDRPNARGRAYDPDRFKRPAEEEQPEPAEEPEVLESEVEPAEENTEDTVNTEENTEKDVSGNE